MTGERSTHRRAGSSRSSAEVSPGSAREALARAGRHGRRALAETLRALGCLLDAVVLASGAEARGAVEPLRALFEAAAETVEREGDGSARDLLHSVAEALEAEIGRWERRSRDDDEARAVLRAFLGLREILWELGVRPAGRPRSSPGGDAAHGRRVERVPVEG